MTVSTRKVNQRLKISAKTDSKRVHITRRLNGWAVRKEGNLQASKVASTQKEALVYAKKLVKSGRATTIIVHNKDGKFRTAK